MDEFVTWSFTYGKNVQMRIPVHVNSQLYANELSLIKLPSFIKLMLRCGKNINNGIEILFIYGAVGSDNYQPSNQQDQTIQI
jgi:hypothetical protein